MEQQDDKRNTFRDLESQNSSEPEAESSTDSTDPDLRQSLQAKTEEAQAAQDKLLRLAAEFENYKRLTQREQREQAKFANENLLKELLPTLDNLERAISHSSSVPGCDRVVEGVQLTLKQFLETLTKFGVRQIKSVGERFDPALHQAVAHVPSGDKAPNTVIEEYQKGYLLHDRVVRAAMVTVAAPDGGDAGAETLN